MRQSLGVPSTILPNAALISDRDWSADLAAWWKRRPVPPHELPLPAAYRERLASVRRLAVAGVVGPDAVAAARWLLADAERRAGEAADAREAWKREGDRLRARAAREFAGDPGPSTQELTRRREVERARRARVRARMEADAVERARWAWRIAIAWVKTGRSPGGQGPASWVGRRSSYATRREARTRGGGGWG